MCRLMHHKMGPTIIICVGNNKNRKKGLDSILFITTYQNRKSSEMRFYFCLRCEVARVEFLLRSHSVLASLALLYKCHTAKENPQTEIFIEICMEYDLFTPICAMPSTDSKKENNDRNSCYIYCFHQVVS